MAWVELVMMLAVLQYIGFAVLVGRARGKYGIQAPAVTGDEMFERFYRVQMNTLELLPPFLASIWLAAQHINPLWAAGLGSVYLVGRLVYLQAYIAKPASRGMGFMLSMLPVTLLALIALVSAVRATAI